MASMVGALKATLLAIIASGVPAVAGAANWQLVHEDATKRVYVDTDSVRRDDVIVSAWLKLTYATEQQFSGRAFRSDWMHMNFRCDAQLAAVKGGVLFSGPDLDGERVFETEIADVDRDWSSIKPASVYQKALKVICQARPQPDDDAADRLRIRAVAPSRGMQLLMGDHWSIYLDGDIDPDAAVRFAQVVSEKNIEDASVYLNSQGGNLTGAMELGQVIRKHGFWTDVARPGADPDSDDPGVCFSACPFAYAGGVWRFLRKGSQLGVHRFHGPEQTPDALAVAQELSARVTEYLAEMGVSSELFSLMSRVPSDDIRVLTRGEALRTGIVNDGRGPPEWSVESNEGGFYLRGYQDSMYGPGMLVFGCPGGNPLLVAMYEVTNAEEIAKESTESAIRIDEDFVPAKGGDIWYQRGSAMGTSDLDAETIERIENAEEIGFAFNGRIPGMFQGFAVEIGDAREKVKNFLNACGKGE